MNSVDIISLFSSSLPMLMCLVLFISFTTAAIFELTSFFKTRVFIYSFLIIILLNMAPIVLFIFLMGDFKGPIGIPLFFTAAFFLTMFSGIGAFVSKLLLDQITVLKIMSISALFNFAGATWLDLFDKKVVCQSPLGLLDVNVSIAVLLFIIFFIAYTVEMKKLSRLCRQL